MHQPNWLQFAAYMWLASCARMHGKQCKWHSFRENPSLVILEELKQLEKECINPKNLGPILAFACLLDQRKDIIRKFITWIEGVQWITWCMMCLGKHKQQTMKQNWKRKIILLAMSNALASALVFTSEIRWHFCTKNKIKCNANETLQNKLSE